jgi:hypothetical protein
MIAQKVLEGENYITISMIPYIIFKIRQGLQEVLTAPTSSVQAMQLVQKMLDCFEIHWGSGIPGTVAIEHLTFGPNRRPKGIPKRALMASLLDPRFKFGPGLSEDDKTYLFNCILEGTTATARAQDDVQALERGGGGEGQQ